MIILILVLLFSSLAMAQNPAGPRVDIVPAGTGTGQTGELRFYELVATGVNYTGFQAPDSLAGNVIYTMPGTDGSSGDCLITNGSGTLSWSATCGGGGGGGDVFTDVENIFTEAPQTVRSTTENASLRLITDTSTAGGATFFSGFSYSDTAASLGITYGGLIARGTESSPTATQDGDRFFNFSGSGWDGSSHGLSVEIRALALGAFSGSNHGGYLSVRSVRQGTAILTQRASFGRRADLAVGTDITPSSYPQFLVGNTGAATRQIIRGDNDQLQSIRLERPDGTAWTLWRPGSASGLRVTHSSTGDVAIFEADGDWSLTTNDRGIWFADTGATLQRMLWMDGSNSFHVGPASQTLGSGGDVTLHAHGGAGSEIAAILDWVITGTGEFKPTPGSQISLGASPDGRQWFGGYFDATVRIDSTALIGATFSIEDEDNGGDYTQVRRASGGVTHAITLPNDNASGVLTNDGSGNLSWVPGGGESFTCNTASNCFNLTDTQAAAGDKTFSGIVTHNNNIRFGSSNTYSIGLSNVPAANVFADTVTVGVSTGDSGQVVIFDGGAGTGTTFQGERITGVGAPSFPGGVSYNGNIVPNGTNAFWLGTASRRWQIGYFIAGDFSGGLVTGASSNSTFHVGSGGSFYNRIHAVSSTSVDCSGVANGWTAVTPDNYVVVCRGGARYRSQLVSF